ncbi:hypothetical protein [Microbacterium sp.]|uniref:hypothetical protein n=1 Tax=Microbacterium sp. TaxID=51671 RepID=UPI003F955079
MSNPMDDQEEDRPTVVGTDPDMNIGDDNPAAEQRADNAEDADDDEEGDKDEIQVEDLP